MDETEVLIAGAGPTGLVLALWLVRQGVKVRIVDRSEGPGTSSRAMAVQARTLELYRQLGLADEIVAGGLRNPALNLWVKGGRRARLAFRTARYRPPCFSSESRCLAFAARVRAESLRRSTAAD